jgi:hypothetical protein
MAAQCSQATVRRIPRAVKGRMRRRVAQWLLREDGRRLGGDPPHTPPIRLACFTNARPHEQSPSCVRTATTE